MANHDVTGGLIDHRQHSPTWGWPAISPGWRIWGHRPLEIAQFHGVGHARRKPFEAFSPTGPHIGEITFHRDRASALKSWCRCFSSSKTLVAVHPSRGGCPHLDRPPLPRCWERVASWALGAGVTPIGDALDSPAGFAQQAAAAAIKRGFG